MRNGPTIDGYSDLTEFARGGYGTVYRARQDRVDRVVALKVLDQGTFDERDHQRFERECRAMGKLSWHPHVVAIHDSGITAGGQPYLAMEFLEDGSFGDRIARQPLPWPEAVNVAIEVLGALGAAHETGTLHRDLKPENILIGPFGEAKLGDFGIAALDDAARSTTGRSSFTVAHVAPEVLRGHRPDERSDLYGVASTLHTLISGRPPFDGDRHEPVAAQMMRVLEAPPPRLGHGATAALADIVEWALAKDPASRPASAQALGTVLQTVQRESGLPVTELRVRRPGGVATPATPGITPDERRGDPTPTTRLDWTVPGNALASAGGAAVTGDAEGRSDELDSLVERDGRWSILRDLSGSELAFCAPTLAVLDQLLPPGDLPLIAWAVDEPVEGLLVACASGLLLVPNDDPFEVEHWPGSILSTEQPQGDGLMVGFGLADEPICLLRPIEAEVDLLEDVVRMLRTNRTRRKLLRAFDQWLEEPVEESSACCDLAPIGACDACALIVCAEHGRYVEDRCLCAAHASPSGPGSIP